KILSYAARHLGARRPPERDVTRLVGGLPPRRDSYAAPGDATAFPLAAPERTSKTDDNLRPDSPRGTPIPGPPRKRAGGVFNAERAKNLPEEAHHWDGICSLCNSALRLFRHCTKTLRRVATYLERHLAHMHIEPEKSPQVIENKEPANS